MATFSTTEPWGPIGDYWSYGLQQARDLYDEDYPVYDGPRTTGYGPTMRQAMSGIEERATAGSPWVKRAQDAAGGMMTPPQNPVSPWLAPLNSTAPTPMTGQFQQWAGGTGAPGFEDMRASGTMRNPAMAGVNYTAGGGYLNSNPHLERVIGSTLDDVGDRVNSRFTSSGRYGSGGHAGALADSLGDTSARMRQSAFEAERGRQMQALGMQGTLGEQAAQRRYQAGAGTLSAQMRGGEMARGAYEQDAANRISAASIEGQAHASDQDRALSAAKLTPWLAQADYADLDRLSDLGKFKMGHQQEAINNARQGWMEENFAPYDQLSRYFGYGGGVGGGAGQTTTEAPSYGNPWLTGIGGAAQGVGVLKNLSDLGIFGDLFGASDGGDWGDYGDIFNDSFWG